jgi:POT family proton-dependent oligopeptide transporter
MADLISEPALAPAAPRERTFFGYPRWYGTLFVVDIWERFSFYGMLAILYLYVVAEPARGGLGMSTADGAALSGLYLALVFIASLPGGWLADRVLGPQRATMTGGLLIVAGHVCLAVPVAGSLYPGLALIVAGTGLVKPSMAAMIGQLYRDRPEQREAAFSLFYTSIQVSALLAPLATGYLGERVNWHLGFGVAAAGMLAGVVQFAAGRRGFGDVGRFPASPLSPDLRRIAVRRTGIALGLIVVLATAGAATGTLRLPRVLMVVGLVVLATPVLYLRGLRRDPALDGAARRRIGALTWMLLASSGFWLLFAQGPALLNLFAQRSVDRDVGGFTVPASWFQSVQPLFLLLLSPLAALLWLRLGRRIAAPPKFAAGLLGGGLAFLLMAAAASAAERSPVSPWWLVGVYLLLVGGELGVAPIGLSLAAHVAPPGYAGRLLGLFWLFAAVGAAAGGQLSHLTEVVRPAVYFGLLGVFGVLTAGALAIGARVLTDRLSTAAR